MYLYMYILLQFSGRAMRGSFEADAVRSTYPLKRDYVDPKSSRPKTEKR